MNQLIRLILWWFKLYQSCYKLQTDAFMFVSICFLWCSLVNGFKQSQPGSLSAPLMIYVCGGFTSNIRRVPFCWTKRLWSTKVKFQLRHNNSRKENSIASWIHCWYQSAVVKLKHWNHKKLSDQYRVADSQTFLLEVSKWTALQVLWVLSLEPAVVQTSVGKLLSTASGTHQFIQVFQ